MPQPVFGHRVDSLNTNETEICRAPVFRNLHSRQVTRFQEHAAVQVERAVVDNGLEYQVAISPGARVLNP